MAKKRKILRIIARMNIGGPAIQAVLLTEGLDRNRFDSLLVHGKISKGEGDMIYYARERKIKSHFVPGLKRELDLFSDLAAFKAIYNIIKSEPPDIIHTHTAKAGALGRLAGILYNFLHPFRGKQIKLIHTFHGHIFEGYFNKFKTKLFIFIERFLALFTSKIITVSETTKDELISLNICGEDKIIVIPLGFELENFLGIPLKNNNTFNIGIVGRLVPIKNHRLFLEAAARVLKDSPQMKLRFKIIGDGELKEELKKYACKLHITESIDFLGWQKDLAGIYSHLDIVALTSLNEGMPVSLIEAMASSRAVVATDVGGVNDLLGKEIDIDVGPDAGFVIMQRGILVKRCDPISFGNALNFILRDDKLRQGMGLLARNFVKTTFTKNRLIKDVENLYGILICS